MSTDPVRLAVAQKGDTVIATYSHGPHDKRKVRMRRELVRDATPAFLFVSGSKFRRDTGAEVGSGSARRKLVDPTPENLKLVAECDAEWEAERARQEAANARAKAERAAHARAAAVYIATSTDVEHLIFVLGEQTLNDAYDSLRRENKIEEVKTEGAEVP